MSNLAVLNTEEDIVQKMDITDIDLFTAAKTRKRLFKCFVLRTYLQFCISFSSVSGPEILAVISILKIPLSIFATFAL